MLSRLLSSEVLTEAERLAHHGWQMLAFNGKPQFPSSWASPQGCLNVLQTRKLASLGATIPETTVPFII